MKKTILATATLLVIVSSASANSGSVSNESPSIFSIGHNEYAQRFDASDVAREQNRGGQPTQRAKTREEVKRELKEHQERMRTDQRYAEEWRSMYEN